MKRTASSGGARPRRNSSMGRGSVLVSHSRSSTASLPPQDEVHQPATSNVGPPPPHPPSGAPPPGAGRGVSPVRPPAPPRAPPGPPHRAKSRCPDPPGARPGEKPAVPGKPLRGDGRLRAEGVAANVTEEGG